MSFSLHRMRCNENRTQKGKNEKKTKDKNSRSSGGSNNLP